MFDRFGADLPPLAGIYLAAFGGGPITLLRHDRRRRHRDVPAQAGCGVAAAPAVAAAHRSASSCCSRRSPGLTGSRWLAHYAATTTFLDTFALARRAAGLPATAINWGLWKSLADGQSEEERQVTLDSGLEPMADDVAIQALASLDRPGCPGPARPSWPPTGRCWPPRTGPGRRCTSWTTCCRPTPPAATARRRTQHRVPRCIARWRPDPAPRSSWSITSPRRSSAAMGLASRAVARPGRGLLPVRDGFADECDAAARPVGQPRRGAARVGGVRLSDRRGACRTTWPRFFPSWSRPPRTDSADDYDDFSDDELLKELSERLG